MALVGKTPEKARQIAILVLAIVFVVFGVTARYYQAQNKELQAILNGTTQMRFGCEAALKNCYEENRQCLGAK